MMPGPKDELRARFGLPPRAPDAKDELRARFGLTTDVTVGGHISTEQALAATPQEVDEGVFSVLNTPSAALRYVILKAVAPDKVGTFSQERQRTWKDFIAENVPEGEATFQIGPDAPEDFLGRVGYLARTGQFGKFMQVYLPRVAKGLLGDVADIGLDPTIVAGKAAGVVKAVAPTAVAKVGAAAGAVGKVIAKPAAAVGLTAERVGAVAQKAGEINQAGGEAVRKVLGIVSKEHELTPALRAHIMPQDAARIVGQNEANKYLKGVELEIDDVRRGATKAINDRKIDAALESTDEAGELSRIMKRMNATEKDLYNLYTIAREDVETAANAQLKARAMGKDPAKALLSSEATKARFKALRQTTEGVTQAERGGAVFAASAAEANVKSLAGIRGRVDDAVEALDLQEGVVKAGLTKALNDRVDNVIRAAERKGGSGGVLAAGEEARMEAKKIMAVAKKKAATLSPAGKGATMAAARQDARRTIALAKEERPVGRALSKEEFEALEFPFLEGEAVERAARGLRRPKKAKKAPLTEVEAEVRELLRKHFGAEPQARKPPAKAPEPVAPKPKPPLRSVSKEFQAEDTARAARVFRKVGARLAEGKPLTAAKQKVLDRYRPVLERERGSVKRKMSAINYVEHLRTKDEAVKVAKTMMLSKSIGRTTVGPQRTIGGKLYEIERTLGKGLFNRELDEIMQSGLTKGLEAVVNARTARDLIEDGVTNGYMSLKDQAGWRTLKSDPFNIFVGANGSRARMPEEVAKFVENHWITQAPGSLPWETFKTVNQWINKQFITSSPVSLVRDIASDAMMMLHHVSNPIKVYRTGKRIDGLAAAAKSVERERLLEAVGGGVLEVPMFATDAAKLKKTGTWLLSRAPPILIPGTGVYWRRKASEWARLGLFDHLRKQGLSVEEAARKVKLVLLDYDPRSFSAIENKLIKPLVPFYSFFRRNAETQAKMLMGANGTMGFQVSILPFRLKKGIEGGQTRDERFEHESSMAIQASRGGHWDPNNFFAQSDFFDTLERVAKGELFDIGTERSGPLLFKKIYEVGANKSMFTGRGLVPPERAADSALGNIIAGGIGQKQAFLGLDIDKRWIHLLGVFRAVGEVARFSDKESDRTLFENILNGLGWPRSYNAAPEKVAASNDRSFKGQLSRLRAQLRAVSADELTAAEKAYSGKLLDDMKSAIWRGDTDAQRGVLAKIEALIKAQEARSERRRHSRY